MNCVITSANIFSGQSAVTSRIFPVQLAGPVRKSTPDRLFICPILRPSYDLTTQAEVDAFPQDCGLVHGGIQVQSSSNITNLAPLAL